jgi:hypothetical protein
MCKIVTKKGGGQIKAYLPEDITGGVEICNRFPTHRKAAGSHSPAGDARNTEILAWYK